MNKQLLIETIPFIKHPILINESLSKEGDNLFVEGILATVEQKNGNGRYYRKELWERELENFNKKIQAKSTETCGELDHPECFIDGFKILTLEKGWVEFKDIIGDEHIATINPNTRNLEFQLIEKTINQPYEGDIYNFESKTFQANVTPNHRFIVENHDSSKLIFRTAEDIYNTKGIKIPKLFNYIKEYTEKIIIKNKFGEIEISSKLFSKFMGWWLAEGWLGTKKYNKRIGYGIFISQSKKENLKEIDDIYNDLSIELKVNWNKYINKREENQYYIFHKVLYEYLSQFGLCNEKFIPKEIKNLDKENIQIFLDSYLKADGTKQNNQEVYYTTSSQIALDLSELINLTGYMSSISEKTLFYEKYLIEGKWIKDFDWYTKKEKYQSKIIENKKRHYTGKTLYSIRRKYSSHYHINDCKISKSHYNGNIYCVSVPNETILVMSPNGSTFWSGNSSIINLKNASHAVRKLWWDGNYIKGLLEIFCSEGRKGNEAGRIAGSFFYNNLLVGISSRGLGSLEQNGDILEVQDDFELLTWDLVSNPSNIDSYMKISSSQLNEGKYSYYNPYDNVQSIITDILCANGTCPIF